MGEPRCEEERIAGKKEAERRREHGVDGGVDRTAARERHYLLVGFTPLLEAACYNHSDKLGQINFLDGVTGYAKERTGTTTHLPPITKHDLVSLSIHDGFQGTTSRASFLLGSDRIILDTHPYFAFDGAPNDSPIAPSTDPLELQLHDTSSWIDTTNAGVKQLSLASMDATIPRMDDDVQISPVLVGVTRSPLWSYQFGLLQTGFMPIDPCDSVGVVKEPFDGVFSAWQTGGVGAGTIVSAAVQSNGQQPPATLPNAEAPATPLPTHIPTASIVSLTFVTPVAGCTYPDAWSAIGPPVPGVCTETP
ncbi:hypothetical protein DFH08DRAFT_1078433 [Mycena albidolilacea]|uniref:Uncharacterized protein n=1 Tax=Mycena albidolilacea TaxID=1033008 RepID=A0AAD7A8N2_9AGAR|nr:hypothetical protein DFH08DRAFT_1078433 [Mycena albidolilacea]